MRIYYFAPDLDGPMGGIKQIYRHVNILNSAGFEARVLHRKKGFRITWFANEAPITYLGNSPLEFLHPLIDRIKPKPKRTPFDGYKVGSNLYELSNGQWATVKLQKDDILVLPEFLGSQLVHCVPDIQKVIFNQNVYSTFYGYGLNPKSFQTIYDAKNVLGAIIVSEDSKKYLNYGFPRLPLYRVFNGIDTSLFKNDRKKEKLVAFMPRKLTPEVIQVLLLLQTKKLNGWQFAPMDGISEKAVADILNRASIFMSFSSQEGLGLPPLEAAVSGCLLVGYTGNGGDEYFLPDLSYPITQGKTLDFAMIMESVMREFEQNETLLRQKANNLSSFVKQHYSLENERNSVIMAWKSILEKVAVK